MNQMLNEGDIAPDFALDTANDRRLSLSETLRGGHRSLLVLLRHLG